MLGFLKKLFGSKHERDVKEIQPLVAKINAEWAKLQSISNDELRGRTNDFRNRIKEYLSEIEADIENARAQANATEDVAAKQQFFDKVDGFLKERDKAVEVILQDLLPEAFATVKEASRRFAGNAELRVTATEHDQMMAKKRPDCVRIEGSDAVWSSTWNAGGTPVKWDMVHYDVQLIGGTVLHQGKISEMATGEGKTLVSTLPAYLNGLTGFGVHIVTVNNYLARRDAEWMGPLHNFLLLTTDCIDLYQPHSPERIAAYKCDIIYGTNNEFGFDYLRDNMVREANELVQGKYHFAMVDEVDSVLIDDARTPLIISGPVQRDDQTEQFMSLKPRIERLVEAQRKLATNYLAEAKSKIETGNAGENEGDGGLALFRAYRALPKNRALIKYLSEPGIASILRKVENFYMQENSRNMKKVDAPLLFVIEEKNRSVELRKEGIEMITLSGEEPTLFILPDLGTEMAKIEKSNLSDAEKAEAKDKLVNEFNTKSEMVHSIDQMLKAYAMFNKDEDYVVMDGQVKIVDEQTGRIMEGRRWSDGLHQAVEAKEGVKIEKATTTYATITLQNYFRMYHKLCGMTGTAETEATELWEIYKLDVVTIPTNRPIIRKDKDDLVYKTEKEKYNAIIDEVAKLREQGRPVLVGTTSVEKSELLSRLLNFRQIPHNVLNAKHHQREAEIVAAAGQSGAITIATNMAGRGTDIKLGPGVREAGGLAIVGTERHDSRRVDRQLRGRAGRQGDPGTTQFFVCLEDKLMRLFGSERIAGLMDKMGHVEGDVIQHSMVTGSIERAQKKVEENHFGTRKRLLEYDDVMNLQRVAIYKMRQNALSGERLSIDLSDIFYSLGEELVSTYKGNWEEFKIELFRFFDIDPPFTEAAFAAQKSGDLAIQLHDYVMEYYAQHNAHSLGLVMPVIKDVYQNQGGQYRNILIPFTDGRHMMELPANLERAVASEGRSVINEIEKTITLSVIDQHWKDHLLVMDELKDSVQTASFEQKDPLVVYKREAFKQFQIFLSDVRRDIAGFLFRGTIPVSNEQDVQQARAPQRRPAQALQTNKIDEDEDVVEGRPSPQAERPKQAPIRNEGIIIGRNDACPCGSGKKFKQCHGK